MRRFVTFLAWAATLACVLALIAGAGVAYVFYHYGKTLPDYRQLADYQPPTATRIHAGDGRLLAEYAKERRVFVPIEAIPAVVQNAFISAEDQRFRTHFGVDVFGIVRAAIDFARTYGTGQRPQGASTITQQVAKNFLLTNELSIERKIKEAILAIRMESTFDKDHILELYLNEIFLGKRSYGVAAAAQSYFGKSLAELTVSEAAFLGGLPKAPSRYDPAGNPEGAIARRNYVLGRMVEDGHITREQYEAALKEPLELGVDETVAFARADFFTEEVRRELVEKFGAEGFYAGGLSVRTTVQPELQAAADRALREGLSAYDRRHNAWTGPLATLDLAATDDLPAALRKIDPGFELLVWKRAVTLDVAAASARLMLEDGSEIDMPLDEARWARRLDANGKMGPQISRMDQVLAPGDVVLVHIVEDEDGNRHAALRQQPEIEGALMALDPHTGRVLAMSGGFSFRESKFNRATQARRQPGSAFKPFVYLAGLEAGLTPASIILDAPLVVDQGPGLPRWKPENYSTRFYGPSTMRLGVEKSRNLMTVRLAQEIGMNRVVDVARRFGIGDGLGTNLAASLGSNEIDLAHITAAYAMLVNGGKKIEPVLVERIQDRFGRTVMRRDERPCPDCRKLVWDGAPPPALPDTRERVEDPRLAYQMVHILEGVIERGTGRQALQIGKPLAGKTGTTNDSKDAWFVGFSPDLALGVYVGFDKPRSLGRTETGASAALPIWIDFMKTALADQPATPFRTPPGVRLVRVDAETGLLPGPDTKTIIAEAFLPGTEPVRRSGGTRQAPARTDDGSAPSTGVPSSTPSTSGLY